MAQSTDEALAIAWRALGEMADDRRREGWRTIPIERPPRCRILAGRRFRSGEEAVLIGFPPNAPVAKRRSLPRARGFHVETITDRMLGDTYRWLALVREPAGDLTMFARMASDIIALLHGAYVGDLRLFDLFTGRILAWQAFMESGRENVLTPAAEVGLVGELCFLRQIIAAGVVPTVAVDGWRGPLDGLHDFLLGAGAVEVKATTVSGAFPAMVASLDQLDDSLVRPLFLVGIRLALGESGRTLPETITDIGASLSSAPIARARFADLVLQAGVLDSLRDRYVRRFSMVRTMLFPVADAFPRLTRHNVTRAVKTARYELDLEIVNVPETSLEQTLRELHVIQEHGT